MKAEYILIEEEFEDLCGERRMAYGIELQVTEEGAAPTVREIRDISSSKEALERLVELANTLELSPMHLDDVIEDFLVDCSLK